MLNSSECCDGCISELERLRRRFHALEAEAEQIQMQIAAADAEDKGEEARKKPSGKRLFTGFEDADAPTPRES